MAPSTGSGRVKAEPTDACVPRKTYTAVRMNPAQAKIVQAAFALDESPNLKKVEELSVQTGLTVKWLRSWYQRTKAAKRKKELLASSAKTSKISNIKSEYNDQALHAENTQVTVASSTLPLAPPQQFNSSSKQRPKQRPPSFPSRTPTSSSNLYSYERYVRPQPNIDPAIFPSDSSSPLLEQSTFNDPVPTHTSSTPSQYSRNYYAQPHPPRLLSTRFSPNEQCQYVPNHPEASASEPVMTKSSRNPPFSTSESHTSPNIPNRAEHMYAHYTATGTSSLIMPPSLPFSPSEDVQLLYPDHNYVTEDGDNNDDLPHEAVTPTLQAYSLPGLDFSSLAAQLPHTPFSEYRAFNDNSEYNYNYDYNYDASLAHCNPNRLIYEDAAEKARDIVLRSLNEGLVERDPFQAAMGLVVLSRLGLQWD